MLVRLGLLVGTLFTHTAAVSSVAPSLIPINASTLYLQASSGESTVKLNLTGTDGMLYVVNASGPSGGTLSLAIPPSAVAADGVLRLASGTGITARVFGIVVFAEPVISAITPTDFSSVGVLPATLTLAASSPAFPVSSGVLVRVVCNAGGSRSLAEVVSATAAGSTSFWYSAAATISADERSLGFSMKVGGASTGPSVS